MWKKDNQKAAFWLLKWVLPFVLLFFRRNDRPGMIWERQRRESWNSWSTEESFRMPHRIFGRMRFMRPITKARCIFRPLKPTCTVFKPHLHEWTDPPSREGEPFRYIYPIMRLAHMQIPLHRITDSASNGSVFPVVTEHFSASSDHAFL